MVLLICHTLPFCLTRVCSPEGSVYSDHAESIVRYCLLVLQILGKPSQGIQGKIDAACIGEDRCQGVANPLVRQSLATTVFGDRDGTGRVETA